MHPTVSTDATAEEVPSPMTSPVPSPSERPLFDDPRGTGPIAPLDLWRVHLEQCPDCGRVHGGANAAAGGVGGAGRPERHLYEYTAGVSDDILCPLCGEVFQSPVQTPCGHHFCNLCLRTLLTRTGGKVACPLDGQVITRFAMRTADSTVLERVEGLTVRCPVCGEEVRKSDLQLHLQDPVSMVESRQAYDAILRPFYMSCPLSKFTVGELNGSAALIRFYRRLGEPTLRRFVLTTEEFIVGPDPKMGFQPHTDEDIDNLRKQGGYFNAWWVHPSFRREVWWQKTSLADASGGETLIGDAVLPTRSHASSRDEATSLLGGHDCSGEPWHESSFVHTWSTVRKPSSPRYLCCLRDLRGDDVPMLEAFRKEVHWFLQTNYQVDEKKVWIYCHYPSSARYSTLHFHIIFEGQDGSRFTKYARKLDRPHQLSRQFPLDKIIDALRRDPAHFETCTLTYFLGDKADLMDPISAFFGCSPHRYLFDFTFHWDPEAVPQQQQQPHQQRRQSVGPNGNGSDSASPSVPKGGRKTSVAGAAGPRSSSKPRSNTLAEERLMFEVSELRHTIECVKKNVEELCEVTKQVAKNQQLEESGACKFALLQLSRLSSQEMRTSAWQAAFFWALGGALVGALAAAAWASVRSAVRRGPD